MKKNYFNFAENLTFLRNIKLFLSNYFKMNNSHWRIMVGHLRNSKLSQNKLLQRKLVVQNCNGYIMAQNICSFQVSNTKKY